MLKDRLKFLISNGLVHSRACLVLCLVMLICGVSPIVVKKANAKVGRSHKLMQPVQQPTPPPTVIKVASSACWVNNYFNQGCDLKESINSGHQADVNVDGGARTSSVVITGNSESLQASLSSKIDYDPIGGPGTTRIANNNLSVAIYVLDTPADIYTINVSKISRSTTTSIRQATDGWRAIGCPCNSADATVTATDLAQPDLLIGTAAALNSNTVSLPEYPGATYRLAYNRSFETSATGTVSNWDYDAAIYAKAELALSISATKIQNELKSVEYIAINSPLDANPNQGGGLRIFPDKNVPDDVVDRKIVKVRAEAGPNVEVFFKSFDIDDPSSNTAPLDPNGAQGNDNRGLPQAGLLNATSAHTNDAGIAEVEFTVTMQPGDNFVIVASLNQDSLNSLTLDMAEQPIPPDMKRTSMLTVWRRVHIEVDSMGRVENNLAIGTIRKANYSPGQNQTRLIIEQEYLPNQFNNPWADQDRFDDGASILIDGIGYFIVTQVKSPHIIVSGWIPREAEGKSFKLYDDDDFNSDDGAVKDGDFMENILAPDTSLIQDSDDPSKNVFALAYVRPVYDIGDGNDLVLFFINSPPAPVIKDTYDFDNIEYEADSAFWTVYLLGAYQYENSLDKDPNNEPGVLGVVDDINGVGASIFSEVLRIPEIEINAVVNNAATTAHEIGHLFNGRHEDLGLMAQSANRVITQFSNTTLAKIRSLSHP